MQSYPITPDFVHGALELTTATRGVRPHRLPAWVRDRYADAQLAAMEGQPSGVRLLIDTTADRIELITHPSRIAYVGADRPRGRIDVVVDDGEVVSDPLTGGDATVVDLATGSTELVHGQSHRTVVEPGPGEHRVELWLPHNETVDLVELRADAPVRPVTDDRRVRWLHHGSSISQGSNAASPTGIWPVVAARALGADLTNLGFGGSALADPFVARVMRDRPADVISVKLGINVVNLDGMRLRTFVPAVHGFLDLIRDGHPTTPILLITPLYCGIHEDTPGPGAVDMASVGTGQVRFVATGETGDTAGGRLTLRVIREALASVVTSRRDDRLQLIDGLTLYSEADAERLPLPDALHPDAETHRLIGERFAATVGGLGVLC